MTRHAGDAAAPRPGNDEGADRQVSKTPNCTPIDDVVEQIRRFVEAVFEPDDLIEIRVIWPDRSAGIKPMSRFFAGKDLAAGPALAWMQQQNAAGWGVYMGASPRTHVGGRDATAVVLARCLFVDFDDDATVEGARRRLSEANLPAPTVMVASGHGVHAYWRLDEPLTDLVAWTARQEALIAILCTDKSIHDAPRVMRLPGFWNTKADPVECRLVEAHAGRRYELAEFPAAVPALPAPQLAASSTTKSAAPGKLSRQTLEFIAHGAGKNDRSNALYRAACDMAGSGYAQAEAEAKLIGPAVGSPGDHPFTEREARATIASAFSKPREPSVPPSGGSGGAPPGGPPDSWPDPQPLPEGLPPVKEFDPGLLPEALRAWAVDIAERIQCPLDFVVVAVMVALSAIVGRKVGIRPKRQDDWTVAPNLYGGVIGRPGVMKTPAITEPLKPLKKLEIEAKAAFESKELDTKAAKRVAEVKKKEADKEIKKVLKNPDEAFRLAKESLEDEEQEEPVRRRYVVNDSTVEKLGEILNENPFGVLVYRDELIGLLKSLDKEGQEGARSFYLEAWNGTGRYTYDRIGRGTIDIEAAIVSVIGGIQPGPLAQYLRAAAKEGTGDDGLIQRFQLLVWPDISKDWVNVDRWPASAARNRAYEVFEGLDHLEPDLLAADRDPYDPGGIPFLRFDDQAQPVFDEWRGNLERLVRSGDLHPALESHLSKFRSLIPSLALLIHLADGGRGPVGVEALNRAIGWGEYLESHAQRIYSHVIQPDLPAARALAKRILAGEVKDGFGLRDIYRKGWTGLATPEDAKGAADFLVDLDWLAEVKRFTEGRPATQYFINPKVHDRDGLISGAPPSGATDGTDESPPDDPSGGSVSGSGGGSPENTPPEPAPPITPPTADDGEEDTDWSG